MARGFTIKVDGMDRAIKRFNSYPKRLRAEINAEFADSAQEMEQRAKSAAPADQGFLRNSISSFKEREMQYAVVSAADYSPYVEFGTGLKVRVPAGLEGYASQFRGGQKGNAKQMIFEWCRRHGIDEKAWYAIYISIMANGVSPRPYFFPQVPIVKPKLITNLKRVVAKL